MQKWGIGGYLQVNKGGKDEKTCVDAANDDLIHPSYHHPRYYTCPSISKNCQQYHDLVVQLYDNTWLLYKDLS